MEYIDALPAEPVSDSQARQYFPQSHDQTFWLGMRYIVSTYPSECSLAILDIDYLIVIVESHRAKSVIELRLESCSYFRLSLVSSAVTWFVDSVVAEKGHNAIKIVNVEGIRKLHDRINDLCG
jgi:hypothetical protein